MDEDFRQLLLEIRGALSQDELATRARIDRVTLARWETGVAVPRLNDIYSLATATGKTINIKVGSPVTKQMIERVNCQLDRGPTDRLCTMSGDAWPSLRAALRAAAWAVDETVVVGSAAAVIRGASVPLGEQVDLLARPDDIERVLRALEEFTGAVTAGRETGSDGETSRYVVHTELAGVVTVADDAPGVKDIGLLIDRGNVAHLNAEEIGNVRFALLEDLLDVVRSSPWPDDRDLETGLGAVLASGRYSARKPLASDAV